MSKSHILVTFFLTGILTACSEKLPEAAASTVAAAAKTEAAAAKPEAGTPLAEPEDAMLIRVQAKGQTVVFELNDSPASMSLYDQLPLSVYVENYGGSEKIFYPPEELEIGDTSLTDGGGEGGLAYFAPWKDVVMYYGSYEPYSGLYDLGTAVSGREWIGELSGEILIEPAGTSSR